MLLRGAVPKKLTFSAEMSIEEGRGAKPLSAKKMYIFVKGDFLLLIERKKIFVYINKYLFK